MTSFTSRRIPASSLAVLIGLSFVSSPLVSAHEVNHENMISGHRPDDMLVAIKNAGYDAEFVSEKGEKPEIEVKFGSDWVCLSLIKPPATFMDCVIIVNFLKGRQF